MHERYKKAMSGVRPSAACTERILNMTEKKQKHFKKGWIVAAAVAAILLCALFTANAATDGALFDGSVLQNLRIIFNGQEVEFSEEQIDVYTVTNENGETVVRHEYALPNGNKVYADTAEDHTAFAMDADDVGSVQIVGADEDGPAYVEIDSITTTDDNNN